MKPSLLAAALGIACLLPATQAPAASDAASRQTDVFRQGLAVFRQQQALAPQAALRYRALPAEGLAAAGLPELLLSGGKLPLAADASFDPAGIAAGQTLRAVSRHGRRFAWRPDIRSPGVPAGARRLGDLRLECLVDAQSGLNPGAGNCVPAGRKADCQDEPVSCLREASLMLLGQLRQTAQLDVPASPYQRKTHYLFIAERPLFGITLSDGARQLALPTVWLYGSALDAGPFVSWPYPRQYLYSLPLESADWPDDTLVVFQAMEPA
ncbi:hypothetical protein [Chromobacterium paludis]|uniref:Uncharacterized protein n=1 Tax=Chromobacterium paludis TaxID=2605945 RepID=A0A5C1DJD1_9NEIS|nr:hypothetical protein [Chromobacterium paludis]QEL56871.1 hypothetical protein FYK34_15530 [Chromobacterium paludis]